MHLIWSIVLTQDIFQYGVGRHLLDLIWLLLKRTPDSKIHGANMGPTWVLPAPDGPHVGPMNLAIRDLIHMSLLVKPGSRFQSFDSYLAI